MGQIESAANIGRISVHPGMMLVLFLVGVGLGAFGYRVIATPAVSPLAPAGQNVPQLIKQGQRIFIPEGSPLRGKLAVDLVTQTELQQNLTLPAVVEADPAHLVRILPPLAGRIVQLNVELGERVEQGQPLAILDSPDVGTAYADYERAKAHLSLALKSRDRLRELVKTSAIAVRDLQEAEAEYLTAEAEQERAEARLRQIGLDPEVPSTSRAVAISAPISGSVIELTVAPGTFWNDPTAALMTIADLNTIWVTANVPEKDTARVEKGQAVDIVFAAYPGETFNGQVLFVSNVLDPDTRRTKVRIELENPGIRFKPGMFANVTFFSPKRLVPIIPTTALVLRDETNQVFVEIAPWCFEPRRVDIDFQRGDQIVIRNGLAAGDRVVARGGVLLND